MNIILQEVGHLENISRHFPKFGNSESTSRIFFSKIWKNIKNIEYEYFPKEEAKYDVGRGILILNNDEVSSSRGSQMTKRKKDAVAIQ